MKRIVIVTHEFAPFRGGIGRVAEGLAEGAVQGGWDPIVVAPDYGGRPGELDDRERAHAVHRFEGHHCSIVSQRRLVRFARRLHRVLPTLGPDLVHGVCPASQMALTALSWFGGVPSPFAFTIHGTELLRYRKELLPRLWMRRAFHGPVGVAVVSAAVRDRLHRDFDVPEGTAFVSHPGVGPEWHDRPASDRATVRAGWGATDRDFVVLTVARRVREKGHDRVVEGIAALPERARTRVLYVVAGTGPDEWERTLLELAGRTGVRLRLLGKVPDSELVAAYDAADLFAMPSRRTPTRLEGLGLTYLEAGSRGLPSLACRTGGVAEAVLDGRTGLLLPPDPSPRDTAAVLLRFLADEAFRRNAGAAARTWARRFTHARHAREVYTELHARL